MRHTEGRREAQAARTTVGDGDALQVALAWLAHPVGVACLALFILNDHVLKAEFGTWWTGKLSDVAGLVFAPALLAVVVAIVWPTARPRTVATASLATVGLAFTLVKATTVGAATASAAWTAIAGNSIVRADATDLLALPALTLAWWVFTHAHPRLATTRSRTLTRTRTLILVPLATLAIAATSSAPRVSADQVTEWDNKIYVGFTTDDGEVLWASSQDGWNFTWENFDRNEYPLDEVLPEGVETRATEDCSERAPDTCFRIVAGNIGVDRSDDGGLTWNNDWPDFLDEPFTPLTSNESRWGGGSEALAVVDMVRGYLVVVVSGDDGFAVRFVDGRWGEVNLWEYSNFTFGRGSMNIPPPPTPSGLIPTAVPWHVWGALAALLSLFTLAVNPPAFVSKPQRRSFGCLIRGFAGILLALGLVGMMPMIVIATPGIAPIGSWDLMTDLSNTAVDRFYDGWAFAVGALVFFVGTALLSRLPKGTWWRAVMWSALGGVAAAIATGALVHPGWGPWIAAIGAIGGAVSVLVVAWRRMGRFARTLEGP